MQNSLPKVFAAKTSGFFDNICCSSYMKEQVSGEPMDFDYEDGNSLLIAHAVAFMEDEEDEGGGEEECKSSGDWSDVEDDISSECGIFSRSPHALPKIKSTEKAEPCPSYHFVKSPSGSFSTATTLSMNTYNTNASWETMLTQRSSRSQSEVSFRAAKTSPPRRIHLPVPISIHQ